MTDVEQITAEVRRVVEPAFRRLTGPEMRQLMRDWGAPLTPDERAEALRDD